MFDYYDSSVFTPPFSPFALLSSIIYSYIEKRKVLNNENDYENEKLNLEKVFSEEYHKKCRLLEKQQLEYHIRKNGEKYYYFKNFTKIITRNFRINVLGRKIDEVVKKNKKKKKEI